MVEEREILERPADPERSSLIRAQITNAFAFVPNDPRGRTMATRDAIEDRGLACAPWTDDGEQLTLADEAGQVGHRPHIAKLQIDIFELEDLRARTLHAHCFAPLLVTCGMTSVANIVIWSIRSGTEPAAK